MQNLKLTGSLTLGIEPCGNLLRIIFFDGAGELVCHKVMRKDLSKFLDDVESHLFKGHLQFNKLADNIAVIVKGKVIGKTDANVFSKLTPENLITV